jgi:hypothetical protein
MGGGGMTGLSNNCYLLLGRNKWRDFEVAYQNAEIGCVQCKEQLAASMVGIVEPFREKRAQLTEDQVQDVSWVSFLSISGYDYQAILRTCWQASSALRFVQMVFNCVLTYYQCCGNTATMVALG